MIMREQARVGKDMRMDAEMEMIEGKGRTSSHEHAGYRKSQGSVFSRVLRNAVENTLIFRTSNLLHCKTVDLCCTRVNGNSQ